MIYLFIFFCLASIIIFTGRKLSIYGDKIGDKKNLEKSWIGIVMLASITSLPELITSSSSSFMGVPEMAISNVFGSNFFNIFIVFIIDVFFLRKTSFTSSLSLKNIFTGLCSTFITLVFIINYFFKFIELKFISIVSIILFIMYLISMKLIYVLEKNEESNTENKEQIDEISDSEFKKIIFKFILTSMVVVLTGVATVYVVDKISVTPIFGITLGKSFVGFILLAIATSLPELTVSIQAVKMENYDMAAGNILGSNLFNLTIIAVADICYLKSGIMEKVNKFDIISALFSIVIIMPLLMGIFFKKKNKKYDSLIIGIIYIIGTVILYKLR